MKHQPRILIVGSQHGDERLGPRLQRYMQKHGARFANVDYLCGNPRAYRANTRFIDTDLNRSYAAESPKTYEQKRAQRILEFIRYGDYDYVLDVHTSTADVGRFFIATGLEGPLGEMISCAPFDRVVVMPPHIADCSLIGRVPQAISVEYDRKLARSQETLEELGQFLNDLLAGHGSPKSRDIYYVRDTITLDADVDLSHKNFVMTGLGFYPILFGEKTYTSHRGFAAYRKEKRVI